MKVRFGALGTGFTLLLVLLASGCHGKARKSVSAPNSADYAENIQALVAKGQMPALHWPNYSDYQHDVTTFYDDRNNEIAWTRDGKPTSAASGFIRAFTDADTKGLRPEDYDASLWPARVSGLGPKNGDALAQFDVLMTINVMRYVSDLRIGRVNPQHFNFDINAQTKKYNLPEFVSDQAVDATDVPKLIYSVEPNAEGYRQTEDALGHYLQLAKAQAAPSAGTSPAAPSAQTYASPAELWSRLQLEGDAAGGPAPAGPSPQMTDALKAYQKRHGLNPDGKLSAETVKSLNVPMSVRVQQLNNSLERWRWLPDEYLHARLVVNLPEFVLRGYDESQNEQFSMKVVVGKVVGEHRTPVFTHMMKYLIFRPFWNVPVDIAKKELVPHMLRSPGYLESKNYEVVNGKGEVQTGDLTSRVEHGGLMVREKPGPKNSLGLVKFMFPNQYDIYLHSTPATELFNRSRRDFSHGCVRVEHPDDLAAWVLQGQTDKDGQPWDLERVQAAMNDGPDNRQVNLKAQLPIVIFYLTAHVGEDGKTDFFDDIYGYDADMDKVLEKGPPYPSAPDPVNTSTQPGDTV